MLTCIIAFISFFLLLHFIRFDRFNKSGFFVSGGRGTALKIAMNKTRTNCFILFRNDKEELLLFSGKRSKRD